MPSGSTWPCHLAVHDHFIWQYVALPCGSTWPCHLAVRGHAIWLYVTMPSGSTWPCHLAGRHMYWYIQMYNRDNFEGHFYCIEISCKVCFCYSKEKSIKFVTVQNGGQAI